jgi:hypothetical protein
MRTLPLPSGPYPRLPWPLDAASEGWARLPPRSRLALGLAAAALIAGLGAQRVARAEARWGGAPVAVLVAAEHLPVGATELAVDPVDYPPAAVPPGAVTQIPQGAALALALPEGSVLTEQHLAAQGPAVGLPAGSRAVPVPVDHGWGVVDGGRVDVWVLGENGQPSRQVAGGAPVLQVTDDGNSRTALIGLTDEEVGPTAQGLAAGGVLLTHAPP